MTRSRTSTRCASRAGSRIVCGVAALSMALGSVASAQQDKDVRADRAGRAEIEGRREPGRPPAAYNGDRRDDRRDDGRGYRRDDHRDWDRRADDRRDWDRRGDDRRDWGPRGRGAGPQHNFYRGGRLPDYYRGREYVVDDWRGHRLQAPPRGYHWVQVGADYVLVAVATGIIASILLNQ